MILDGQFANPSKRPNVRAGYLPRGNWKSAIGNQKRTIGNRNSTFRLPPSAFPAFTLIEMTVVIAIIILLAGLVVPAATQMWRERKIADAQNLVSGMLMTARARAIQSGGAETGLFFFIDDQGAQKVVPITQDPNDPAQTDQTRLIRGWQSDGRWFNVFTVVKGQSFTLPSPMRISPTYIICSEGRDDGICTGRTESERFSDNELDIRDIATVTIDSNTQVAQAHRNFFTLIFAPNGEMIVGRDVLIRDVDDEAEAEDLSEGNGSITGLVTKGSAADTGVVSNFHPYNPKAPSHSPVPIAPATANITANLFPTWLVSDSTNVAFNFPSVDGLLVYDDSLFSEAGDAEAKRVFLMDYGMPFYINRITGAVIRGPVGLSQ